MHIVFYCMIVEEVLRGDNRKDALRPIGKPRVSPLRFLITSAVIRYLICVYASHFFAGRPYHFKHCAPRISSKMATIDECIEFALKNIVLWWRYRISRHCDEWKYIIIERIFESEIILIPPSLKISESSSNGSYRNTDEVWWRYGINRSCDEWFYVMTIIKINIDTCSSFRHWMTFHLGWIECMKCNSFTSTC
jgi:hypothetical protein